jgi:hypothetical protein
MRIFNKVAAGVVTSFLISATYAPVFAGSLEVQQSAGTATEVTSPCAPLSPDAASMLPWFIKPSRVVCMSPTVDDFEAMAQARSLMVRAAAANAHYKDGVGAYAAGRYVEAIAHLHAAVPSAKP